MSTSKQYAKLNKCKTKEDYKKFIGRESNAIKWWLISGVVLCTITRISGFWIFGIFAIVAFIVALDIRPVLKDAKSRLGYLIEDENIERTKALVEHDLSFVKDVFNIVFNREIGDLEAKILRESYLFHLNYHNYEDGRRYYVSLPNFYSKDQAMTEQEIRNDILNKLRKNIKVKNIGKSGFTFKTNVIDQFYSTFKTSVEDYYYTTICILSRSEVVSVLSKLYFGDSGYKNTSKLIEMFSWLENEKDHVLSQCRIDCDLDTEEGGRLFHQRLTDNRETFLKLFNERNAALANGDSSSSYNESNEQPTVGAPQEESNFSDIVLN